MSESESPGNMPPEVDGSRRIADVAPIRETASALVRERADLERFVEAPLLPACLELYDKNIRTWTSSANASNIEHPEHAGIGIHYDSLSERNKQLLEEMGAVSVRNDGSRSAFLHIPIDTSDTVSLVRQKAAVLVDRLYKQKMRWVTVYTVEQIREQWGEPELSSEQIADQTGLYLAPDGQLYLSEEQYNKAQEEVIE